MFVDFNRVFKTKPQTQLTAPEALVNYLNQSVPEGIKYEINEDGDCVITGDGDAISIGGVIFNPSDKQKKILGKNYSGQDVVNYSYNSQQPIELILQREGYIKLNGQEFPVEKISYNPLNPVQFISGSFRMFPYPFPKPFVVTVGCDKYNRDLLVKRVAHNSIYTMAFESDQNDSLCIKYYLNQRNHSFKITMSFDLKNAKTIRDIVESTMIYNAFLDGKGSFMGHQLHDAHTEKDSIRFDDNSAKFWEKVLQVEQALNVHFTPPQDDVDFETMCLVEELYQNLINKTPIKENQVIDSINGKWISSGLSKEIRDSIGKPALFEFVAVKHMNLFGVQKDLPALLQVFNAALADYHPTQNKISVVDESSEKQRYTSSLCFLNDEELEMYRLQDHNQIISAFKDAKRPQEFLEYSS